MGSPRGNAFFNPNLSFSWPGVFYNKVQVFNRDISIVAINRFIQRWRREQEEQFLKEKEKEKRRQERIAKKKAAAAAAESKEAAAGTDAAAAAEQKESSEAPAAAATPTEAKDVSAAAAAAGYVFPGVRILEALAASGLRSIRYWKEIGDGLVKSIVVNDISEDAVAAIKKNIEHNGLSTGWYRDGSILCCARFFGDISRMLLEQSLPFPCERLCFVAE